MQNDKLFPMFVTTDLDATRRFYVKGLGWTPTIEMPNYLQVRSGGEGGPELAFMKPSPFAEAAFEGRGVVVSVPTDDADRHHAAAKGKGLEPTSAPEDRPWGWRSYHLRDPNGVVLDFFHEAAAAK